MITGQCNHQEEISNKFLTPDISEMITHFINQGRSHLILLVSMKPWCFVLIKNHRGNETDTLNAAAAIYVWAPGALCWTKHTAGEKAASVQLWFSSLLLSLNSIKKKKKRKKKKKI